MYRIVDSFGKKGIEVFDENCVVRFYSHLEININKADIPDEDKDTIPNFDKDEHYRVSQLYYYHEKTKELAFKLGKTPEEAEIANLSLEWEREFRFIYYEQYVKDKAITKKRK